MLKNKEKSTKVRYVSIKIREEHYNIAKENKEKNGVNIDFFIGQAIVEKAKKCKK